MKKRIRENIVLPEKITNSILILTTSINYILASYNLKTHNNNFITKGLYI